MGFNINEFKAQGIKFGGQRPSAFKVRIPNAPSGIVSGNADLEFMCRSASIPASTIEPIQLSYYGRAVPIAGDRTFSPWRITMYNDEDFRHRNFFEAWQNKINALVSNRQDSSSDNLLDYMVTAEVLQLGKAGPGDDTGVVRSYQFTGLWPAEVSEINLDWEAGNVIGQFDVTFAYTAWEPIIFHPNVIPYSGILPPDPTDNTTTIFPGT